MVSEEEKRKRQKEIEEKFFNIKNIVIDEWEKQEYYKKCLKMLVSEIKLLKNKIDILEVKVKGESKNG